MKSGDDCEEVRGMSSDYIDGELNTAKVSNVNSHILKCGPCDAFIKTLRATVSLLRSTPKQQPPSDFKQRLRDRLDQEQNN
jgi:anti-sigma factor RsiW